VGKLKALGRRFFLFFFYSLSGRLFLVFLVTSFLLVLCVNLVGMSVMREEMMHYFSPHVRQYFHYIRNDIGSPPNLEKAQALVDRTLMPMRIRGRDGSEWFSSGKGAIFPDTSGSRVVERRHYRLYLGSHGTVIEFKFRGFFYGFWLTEEDGSERVRTVLLLLLGILLLLVVGSYLAVRSQIVPLVEIRAGINRVGEGEWDEPVKKLAMGELGELGRGINGMALRIGRMVRGKKFLLLAMSHELKTPLTSMRVNVELMEPSSEKDRLSQNVAVMEDLIERLLLSERLSECREGEVEWYDISAGLKKFLAEGVEEEVEVRLQEGLLYVRMGEEEWLVLLRNVLVNAFRHTGAGRKCPLVELCKEGEECVLRIVDDGEGVKDEELLHLGEAFYRGDGSRTRATGGTGLGLYLCRLIVEMRSGKIRFSHALGVNGGEREGLMVEVRLPCREGLRGEA
jgi:signal transduction histidine kinase